MTTSPTDDGRGTPVSDPLRADLRFHPEDRPIDSAVVSVEAYREELQRLRDRTEDPHLEVTLASIREALDGEFFAALVALWAGLPEILREQLPHPSDLSFEETEAPSAESSPCSPDEYRDRLLALMRTTQGMLFSSTLNVLYETAELEQWSAAALVWDRLPRQLKDQLPHPDVVH